MYLNEGIGAIDNSTAGLTVTLDVFKFLMDILIFLFLVWLTVTLDVFKY